MKQMADGRDAAEWERASLLASLAFNASRSKDVAAMTPADFNPHAEKQKPQKLSKEETQKFLASAWKTKPKQRKKTNG